jgi:hypothetical protein
VRQLPHKSYDKAQLILFSGKRGFGKTTAMREYLRVLEPRVFALDPFNDFPSIQRCFSVQEGFDDLEENAACRRRFVPTINNGTRPFGDAFFRRVFDSERGLRDCLLCLDEITLWSGSHETESLQKLILQGRRIGIRLLVACQRIQLVPQVMLSEMTHLVIFSTTRPRDLDVIEEWGGRSYSEIAPHLKVGQSLLLSL